LRLVNASPTNWQGRIELCVPWLRTSWSTDLRAFDVDIPGMTIAEIPIALAEPARWLPPGPKTEDRALLVTRQGQEIPVRAMFYVIEWTPPLSVTPDKLTLADDSPHNLTIHSDGKKSWDLQISAASWLTATPAGFTLNGGADQVISVTRKSSNPINDPRALVIIAPGREIEIAVEIKG